MTDLEAECLRLQAKNVELLLLLHTIREQTLEHAALEFSLCKSKKLSREAVVNTLRVMARGE